MYTHVCKYKNDEIKERGKKKKANTTGERKRRKDNK
jgi:hypothetical protein